MAAALDAATEGAAHPEPVATRCAWRLIRRDALPPGAAPPFAAVRPAMLARPEKTARARAARAFTARLDRRADPDRAAAPVAHVAEEERALCPAPLGAGRPEDGLAATLERQTVEHAGLAAAAAAERARTRRRQTDRARRRFPLAGRGARGADPCRNGRA